MTNSKLWMLHIEGPDDIVAAPSKAGADRIATAFNAFHGAYVARRRAEIAAKGGDPSLFPESRAVVAEWDGSPEEHADSVAKYWSDYLAYDCAERAEDIDATH